MIRSAPAALADRYCRYYTRRDSEWGSFKQWKRCVVQWLINEKSWTPVILMAYRVGQLDACCIALHSVGSPTAGGAGPSRARARAGCTIGAARS